MRAKTHLLLLLVGILAILVPTVTSAQSNYNAQAAVAYAEQWWDDRNSNDPDECDRYKDYGDYDCANFVSQCLIAGGLDLSNCDDPEVLEDIRQDGCECIKRCTILHKYLVNCISTEHVTWLKGHSPIEPWWFRPGDPAIFGYTDGDGKVHWYAHAVIAVTGDDTNYATCNAHSDNAHHKTISQFYTANASFDRCTFYHIPVQPIQKPTVETVGGTNVTQTAATLNATITDDGGATIDERRFSWGLTSSCSDGWVTDDPGSDHYGDINVSSSSFSHRLASLEPDTTYYFQAWAHNSAGWDEGDSLSFTTTVSDALPNVDAFDVEPRSVTLDNSFTISYTVTDDIGLQQTELWRATDTDGNGQPDWPDNAEQTTPLSGQTSYSSSFTDAPSSPGTYWYGMHVVDNSGDPEHWNDESNSRTGGLPGVYGPIKVTVYLEQQEEVSSPSEISGPSSTYVNKTESYTASGASSNLGHSLEYRFDWGDGNISGWGSATQSRSWSGSGTFHIKAQARCATHTDKVSSWSGTLSTVTVSYLTLSTNVNPSGGGSVTKNPDKSGYDYNESVQLTANSNSGYNFSHWQGDPPVELANLEWMFENPLVGYIMDRNKAIIAIFTLLEQVSTPTFTPSGGTFTDSVDVEISCSTPDATIRYTTDGSTPNSSEGTVYDGTPIYLTETTMIKAVAYKTGMMDSEIAADTYVIRPPIDIYVDDDAPDDPGPGDPSVSDPLEDGTADHPFDEIQEAIDVALDDDTVIVAEGTYYENLNLNDKDIILTSTDPSNQNVVTSTIVNGDGNDSVVHITNSDVTIAGFTITNGFAAAGGGIYCENSNPTISNCIFSGNIADIAGGGMYMSGEADNAILTNCIFKGNSAEYGGAIVMESEIGNNNATLVNCLFFDNSAVFFGGVMDVWNLLGSMDIELINCTLAGNSAPNGNALSFDSDLQAYPSNLQVSNCILWNGNDEIWNGDGSTITISYGDIQDGWSGQGNIDTDPLFVEPSADDYHLLPDSPCIDAGDNSAVPIGITTDLDGKPRFSDDLDTNDTGKGKSPIVDMGAYEFQGIIGDFCGSNFGPPDGYVDVWDLMQFADHWHTRTGDSNWDAKFDLTGPNFGDLDGYVDVWDLMVFADHWHEGQKP